MNTDPIRFRDTIQLSDIARIRDIVDSTGFFNPSEIDVAVELAQEALEKGPAGGYLFCFAETDGGVQGYACFGPIACTLASFDLYWIAVHDTARGHGFGKKLLYTAENIIFKMGGQRIYIETSSQPKYEPTRQFYLKCGYTLEAVLADFYAPGDGKVIFVKALQAE